MAQRLEDLRQRENPSDWRMVALASCATSTLDAYTRHVKAMATTQFASEAKDPTIILRKYLFSVAHRHATTCGMRQAINACRLLEELNICSPFVPQNVWRLVRRKERLAGTCEYLRVADRHVGGRSRSLKPWAVGPSHHMSAPSSPSYSHRSRTASGSMKQPASGQSTSCKANR